jgi:hypothetical protein
VTQAEQGVQQVLAAGGHADYSRLEASFRSILTRNPMFTQVRWIGEDGVERYRVDRVSEGRIRVVPRSELQDKRHRYYFAAILQLKSGELYISPLDLNVEQGRVELPFKPMLRFGVHVFDRTGRPEAWLS